MCFTMWLDIFLSVITSNIFMSLADELKLWLLEISVPMCSYDLYHYYLWIVCPKPCPCFQWFSSCIMSQNPCPWYTLLQHHVRGIPYFNIYVSKHLDWDIFLWSLRSVFLVPLLLHRWPPPFFKPIGLFNQLFLLSPYLFCLLFNRTPQSTFTNVLTPLLPFFPYCSHY